MAGMRIRPRTYTPQPLLTQAPPPHPTTTEIQETLRAQQLPQPFVRLPAPGTTLGVPPPIVPPPPADQLGLSTTATTLPSALVPPTYTPPKRTTDPRITAVLDRLGQPRSAPSLAEDPRIAQLLSTLQQQTGAVQAGPVIPDIKALLREITQGSGGGGQIAMPDTSALTARLRAPAEDIAPADFSGLEEEQGLLRARLEALLRGEAPDIGDISNDPEARAYRLASLREEETARGSEAERLAAQGLSGSGDFDSRVAQLRERTGEAIAAQEAGLTGQRRREAQQAAITGGGLTMQDLARRAGLEQTLYQGRLQEAGLAEGRRATDIAGEQNLIGTALQAKLAKAGMREGRRATDIGAKTSLFGTNLQAALEQARLRESARGTNQQAEVAILNSLLQRQGQQEALTEGRYGADVGQDMAMLQTLLAEQGRTEGLDTSEAQFETLTEAQAYQLELQRRLEELQRQLLQTQITAAERTLPPPQTTSTGGVTGRRWLPQTTSTGGVTGRRWRPPV